MRHISTVSHARWLDAPDSRVVKLFMRRICNTSAVRRAAPDTYSVAGPVLAGFLGREQEGVALPLVVPLLMIMIKKIGQRPSRRGFTE